MPITGMPVVAPGDTITAAGWNVITGNISLLDGRTGGDPGVVGKIPVSSGALGAAWLAIGTEAYVLQVVGGVPAYALVGTNNISTGAVTGAKITTASGQGVANNNLNDDVVDTRVLADSAVATSNIAAGAVTQPKIADASVTAAKMTPGGTANRVFLTADGTTVTLSQVLAAMMAGGGTPNRVFATVDGSNVVMSTISDAMLGSGIDADTLGTRSLGTGAGNVAFYDGSGRVVAAGSADTAVAVTGTIGGVALASYNAPTATSATTATTATNSTQLGGVAAALYPKYEIGTYSGSGGGVSNKALASAAVPKYMILTGTNVGGDTVIFHLTSTSAPQCIRTGGVAAGTTTQTVPTSTRLNSVSGGFNVSSADGSDASGYSYTYIAWW